MRYCRFSKPAAHHSSLSFHIIVVFSINLRTKCVFLVMLRPPLPPCTHLYALVLTPPPPLGAYVINGRPPSSSRVVRLSFNVGATNAGIRERCSCIPCLRPHIVRCDIKRVGMATQMKQNKKLALKTMQNI